MVFTKPCPIPSNKPDTVEEQVDILWDVVTNHLWHLVVWQDIKTNFVLAILGVMLALLAVLVIK